jgi:hypothetical protein
MQKNESETLSHTIDKNYFKMSESSWMKGLNIGKKTVKLLEGNIDINHHDYSD